MEDVVPMHIRKERSKMLRILSEKKKRAFYESQVGKTGIVLWESQNDNGYINGFTENYIKVKHPYDESLENKLDRKSTRLNSSHVRISYAVFCLKKKKQQIIKR